MTPGFQCFYDLHGDIHVMDGMVMQPKTGVAIAVGTGDGSSVAAATRSGDFMAAAQMAFGGTFVGGSGRNLISTGLVPDLSGPPVPVGFWTPGRPDEWSRGPFILVVTGSSAATISDGVDVVAELTTGGTAPVGDYVATAYGEETYNADAAFTIAVTAEGGTSVGIPDAVADISIGSLTGGTFTAIDAVTYERVGATDWTVVVNSDGTADLFYLTDVMATRAEGSPHSPEGLYVATSLAVTTYGLTETETQGRLRLVGKTPRVGYVYLEVIEDTGEVSEVNGPFFATTLPVPSGDTYYFQIAYSDGMALRQDHVGAVVWP